MDQMDESLSSNFSFYILLLTCGEHLLLNLCGRYSIFARGAQTICIRMGTSSRHTSGNFVALRKSERGERTPLVGNTIAYCGQRSSTDSGGSHSKRSNK